MQKSTGPEQTTDADLQLLRDAGFEVMEERRPPQLVGRFFVTLQQLLGLLLGGIHAYLRDRKARRQPLNLGALLLRLLLLLAWPFLDRKLVKEPFPVQFRTRLERLGPTYIKLGQILSLREDVLPSSITAELMNLLDRLPAVPLVRFVGLIEEDLKRPVDEMFSFVEPIPLGSASLAQTHRAWLITGEEVVLKVLKPGVRRAVEADTKLLRLFGRILQIFLARYQPARLIDEFCRYTLREVNLHFEADNAETFAANFQDEPDVLFPRVYRAFSSGNVLCMEYFRGQKADASAIERLTSQERRRAIDLGVGATVRMIFRDGFFHADLHPANVIIFDDGRVGFIDLGMVGRFDSDLQKRMFSYFYSLVTGDAATAAAYLTAMSYAGRRSNPDGFRRAVEDLNRRWLRSPTFHEFSLGRLVLQSVALSGRYRIEYPGEIILMVKALMTIEGVGNLLEPGINVTEAAGKHIRWILLQQFNPVEIVRDSLLIFPELLDTLRRSPLVINEGLRLLEVRLKTRQPHPIAQLRGTIFSGSLVLAAAIMAASDVAWPIWAGLLFVAFSVAGIGAVRRD